MFILFFIFSGCFNNSNSAIASKHYDFELCANLFNNVKVDKTLSSHSVLFILYKKNLIIYLLL